MKNSSGLLPSRAIPIDGWILMVVIAISSLSQDRVDGGRISFRHHERGYFLLRNRNLRSISPSNSKSFQGMLKQQSWLGLTSQGGCTGAAGNAEGGAA